MSFWAYMLHCRDGVFYVGHTDDLARRIAEHERGAIDGFTRDYLPVTLVWSEAFQTRDEAQEAERRIKAWSRAKKLALIRGDWERISQLAKGKNGPSTSSGKTGEGTATGAGATTPAQPELAEGSSSVLLPHPQTPPLAVTKIRARITAVTAHWLTLRWSIEGADRIILPPLTGKCRADGLWRTTCFEMFLGPPDDAYAELNFSPSESWAAYDFTGYRAGMSERAMPRPPDCTARAGTGSLIFDAAVSLAGLPQLPWRAGLTAVIEEEGGVKSYWAAAHPSGPPDFHHSACRVVSVAAPPNP